MKVRKVLKVCSISPYERYGAEQYMYMAGGFLTVETFLTFAAGLRRQSPGLRPPRSNGSFRALWPTRVIRTTWNASSRGCELGGHWLWDTGRGTRGSVPC